MQIKTKIVSCHTADSKPVKHQVNGTVILPPLAFPDCTFKAYTLSHTKMHENIEQRRSEMDESYQSLDKLHISLKQGLMSIWNYAISILNSETHKNISMLHKNSHKMLPC